MKEILSRKERNFEQVRRFMSSDNECLKISLYSSEVVPLEKAFTGIQTRPLAANANPQKMSIYVITKSKQTAKA